MPPAAEAQSLQGLVSECSQDFFPVKASLWLWNSCQLEVLLSAETCATPTLLSVSISA